MTRDDMGGGERIRDDFRPVRIRKPLLYPFELWGRGKPTPDRTEFNRRGAIPKLEMLRALGAPAARRPVCGAAARQLNRAPEIVTGRPSIAAHRIRDPPHFGQTPQVANVFQTYPQISTRTHRSPGARTHVHYGQFFPSKSGCKAEIRPFKSRNRLSLNQQAWSDPTLPPRGAGLCRRAAGCAAFRDPAGRRTAPRAR